MQKGIKTSVFIPEEDLAVLNRLRGTYIAKEGKKLPMMRLVEACIRYALAHEEEVMRLAVPAAAQDTAE